MLTLLIRFYQKISIRDPDEIGLLFVPAHWTTCIGTVLRTMPVMMLMAACGTCQMCRIIAIMGGEGLQGLHAFYWGNSVVKTTAMPHFGARVLCYLFSLF